MFHHGSQGPRAAFHLVRFVCLFICEWCLALVPGLLLNMVGSIFALSWLSGPGGRVMNQGLNNKLLM